MTDDADPYVARLTVFPIKSLDGTTVDRARLVPGGGALAGDREYAIVDDDGEYVNGKRTAAVHRLQAEYDDALESVRIRVGDEGDWERFALPDDRDALAAWLDGHFEPAVDLQRDDDGGFPDDTAIPGPTVISTATIREVASWFPELDPEGVRRRFRANVEIGGTPPFWEDRLYADEGEVVAFEVGNETDDESAAVTIEGVNPCQRCIVPARDPDTGDEYEGFRERFVRKRQATRPAWLESDRFDHPFRLMVNTRVPEPSRGRTIAVGEPVAITSRRPDSSA